MIDFFDKLYTSLDNRYTLLARLRVYTMMRIVLRRIINIVLPIYFRHTQGREEYRLLPCEKDGGRLIVSLTSFPVRAGRLWLVIETMLRQTVKPDIIVLWLSQKQFPRWEDVPESLRQLQCRGLTIRMVPEDYRSHKKYYYSLKEFPEDHILTIDDDVFYDTHLVERMMDAHKANPNAVITNKARRIRYDADGELLPYAQWEADTRKADNLFVVGAGGNLYPAHCLDEMVADIDQAMRLTPVGDDIWLNAMLRLKHTPVIHASYYFLVQTPVLSRHNVELMSSNIGTNNDVQLRQLIAYLLESRHVNPFKRRDI